MNLADTFLFISIQCVFVGGKLCTQPDKVCTTKRQFQLKYIRFKVMKNNEFVPTNTKKYIGFLMNCDVKTANVGPCCCVVLLLGQFAVQPLGHSFNNFSAVIYFWRKNKNPLCGAEDATVKAPLHSPLFFCSLSCSLTVKHTRISLSQHC